MIVAGYHYWGEEVLDRLRGMFAFVIWDRQERRAFGARDPFGIKPLHYLQTADGVYLASEKKALLPFAPAADAGRRGRRHRQPVALPDPAVRARARHPAPGHQPDRLGGVPHLDPGRRGSRRAASTGRCSGPTPADDPQALYERIRETLRESVRLHMRSDVPVGAFLSSGIDSHRGGRAGPRVQPEHPDLHRRLRRAGLLGDRGRPGVGPAPRASPRSRRRSGRRT